MPAEVGIKSCRFAREYVSFVHAWTYVPTQLELCLYDQLDIASLLIVSLFYCNLYSLFKFLNFYLFLVCLLFIVQKESLKT